MMMMMMMMLITLWQLKIAYIIPSVLFTAGIITNKLHDSLKLLNICPALYILMLKAVALNTCRTVRKFLAEEWIGNAGHRDRTFFWEQLNCCEVRKVDDDHKDEHDDNHTYFDGEALCPARSSPGTIQSAFWMVYVAATCHSSLKVVTNSSQIVLQMQGWLTQACRIFKLCFIPHSSFVRQTHNRTWCLQTSTWRLQNSVINPAGYCSSWLDFSFPNQYPIINHD